MGSEDMAIRKGFGILPWEIQEGPGAAVSLNSLCNVILVSHNLSCSGCLGVR